jgi:hypothetical protein
MIRRDYILRMIEDFIAALRRLQGHKAQGAWSEAGGDLDAGFRQVIGVDAQAAAQLSETELMAKLMQGESTVYIHDKSFMLATLFKEAGDVAVAGNRLAEAHSHYLKGLHLLLGVLGQQGEDRCPEFVPTVELFVTALAGAIPARTQARLMQHYEVTGQFSRAEDALFAILEETENSGALDFGMAFYTRLLARTDGELEAGELPRDELQAGMAELQARRATFH